jgi:hypothetical protein
MWRRRSWFSLKGTVSVRKQQGDGLLCQAASGRYQAGLCTTLVSHPSAKCRLHAAAGAVIADWWPALARPLRNAHSQRDPDPLPSASPAYQQSKTGVLSTKAAARSGREPRVTPWNALRTRTSGIGFIYGQSQRHVSRGLCRPISRRGPRADKQRWLPARRSQRSARLTERGLYL